MYKLFALGSKESVEGDDDFDLKAVGFANYDELNSILIGIYGEKPPEPGDPSFPEHCAVTMALCPKVDEMKIIISRVEMTELVNSERLKFKQSRN